MRDPISVRAGEAWLSWVFGMGALAAAIAGLVAAHTVPPVFIAMTALALAAGYGLVAARETLFGLRALSGVSALGFTALAAWPLYAPVAASLGIRTATGLLIVCAAGLRLLRWQDAGVSRTFANAVGASVAVLALVLLASAQGPIGIAAALQVELLGVGCDWLMLGLVAMPALHRQLGWMDAPETPAATSIPRQLAGADVMR